MESDGRNLRVVASCMIFFITVIILPLSLFGRSAGKIIFSKEKLISFVSDAIISYDDEKEEKALKKTVVSKMIKKFETDITNNTITSGDRDEALIELYAGLMIFGSAESHQVNDILKGILTKDISYELLKQVVYPLDRWLKSDDIYPDISINITPFKEGVTATLPYLMMIPANILPNCLGLPASGRRKVLCNDILVVVWANRLDADLGLKRFPFFALEILTTRSLIELVILYQYRQYLLHFLQ